MKIRTFFAVLLCKLARGLLRLLRRGGTAFPGRVALKVYPQVLGVLSRGVRVILVTGTNGKTTSSRMIEQAFADAGLNYFANRSGANLISGITAEFAMHSTLTGRPKCQFAVIECDEGNFPAVAAALQPRAVIVTNLFRDQLDRYGEITHTLNAIREGITHVPNATLCLNADCSLTASLAEDGIPNPVIRFGVNVPIYSETAHELSDAPYCIHCKTEYVYDYRTYGHLGAFRCPKCGYHREAPQVAVTAVQNLGVDTSDVTMSIGGREYAVHINLPAAYNIYNAVGSAAALSAFGFTPEAIVHALGAFGCGFGRMEKFDLRGTPGRMMLVKNPAGCNQTMRYLAGLNEDATFVVCLNDRDADGTDISWIWDADFERLAAMGEHLRHVYVSGVRADDMRLRLKYAGVDEARIEVFYDYDSLIDAMCASEYPVFIMPTYTAMMDLRGRLQKQLGGKEFWE